MSSSLHILPPWKQIDPADSARYEDEYAVEIAKGHPLYCAPVKAVAHRSDTGEVLFRLHRTLCDYSVVRLTWSGQEETDPTIPPCEHYLDADEVMRLVIRPANQTYKE